MSAVVGELVTDQGAAGQLDQGVRTTLWAGAQVRAVLASRGGRGQRVQGGSQHRGGLGVQPSAQPVQTVSVVDHRELAAAGGPLLVSGQPLGLDPFPGVRGDNLQDVPAEPGQLGRVEPGRLTDQVRLGAPAYFWTDFVREIANRADDRGGLPVADLPGRQRLSRRRQLPAGRAGHRGQLGGVCRGQRESLSGQRRRPRRAHLGGQLPGVHLTDQADQQALQLSQRRTGRLEHIRELPVRQRPQAGLGSLGQAAADPRDRSGDRVPGPSRRRIVQQCAHTHTLTRTTDNS
ncbi:MAG: hypothetical protein WKF47_17070 [Geodermatophilaceae bacterium]